MKKIILLVVLVVIAAAAYMFLKPTPKEGFELEEGYQFLYDGKSLAGWRAIGGEATFEARGDDIVGTFGPGENSFLRTEKTYGDFSLKMQMRWDELGNSGVLFRAQQREGDGRAYGYQYELDASDRAWSAGIYDEARRGWLANLESNADARAAIRLDDWNDIEIEARGAQLRTWINGVPAADIIDGLDARGFIALQVHAGNSGSMRWRHIRLRELPGMAVDGADLMDEAEWRNTNIDNLTFSDNSISAAFPEGEFWLSPRRQFSDALIRFTARACTEPTTVRVRHLAGEGASGASFAEVKIHAAKATARVVIGGKSTEFEPILLPDAASHSLTVTSLGKSLVLSVGEQDVMRLPDAGLPGRGRVFIQPARCDATFSIEDFSWFALRESNAEPLFYQTLDNAPAPVLTPKQALEVFRIAPGFNIELVAAEPLVEDPVAMAWDEHGRLYVVEMRGYMPDPYGTGSNEPVGQVVRLSDDDGDGRMDRSEIFFEKLVNPRAIAVVNEGVLVGVPPNLILCTLPTKDAVCSAPEIVGVYGADVSSANVEHMENGLRQGLDNWLYNSKSARQVRLVQGELLEREGLFRGQWGITKDDYGRWLYNHNSTWVQADYFAAEDILRAGQTRRYAGLGENLTPEPEVFTVRVNPGVNRAYLDNTLREDGRLFHATGVSGLVSYRGDQFPAQFRGDVFVPEVAGNVVAQFAMADDGLALTAQQRLYDDEQWGQRDFLASTDERFRPVDAMNGPDGALYIIDMYRGIVQDDHFLTDELREQIFQRKLEKPLGMGRIWRVTHSAGSERATPRDLGVASTMELVEALRHSNGWIRDTAQRLLLARKGQLQAPLSKLALGDDTRAALHAIWALAGRGELQRSTVLEVAVIDDVHRQVNVLRAGKALLNTQDWLALHQQLGDSGEAVKMQLILAMASDAEDERIRTVLADLLESGHDSAFMRQAVVRAVRDRETEFLGEFLQAGKLGNESDGAKKALTALANTAYRSLRGDLTSNEAANPALLQLLELTASRSGQNAWQQIALLSGFAAGVVEEGFVPAQFSSPPPIFADSTISENDPLWAARLAGRVAFTWPGDELAMGIKPLSPEQLQGMALGEAFYPQCATCHGERGQGIDGLAPPLAGAQWVTGPPEWLARIILQGINGPLEVKGETWNGVMPPHGHIAALDDATLAGLMTYLRRSWGNKSDPVSVQLATDVRQASAERSTPWTSETLRKVPFDRGFSRFIGEYSVSFLKLTVSEKPEGLHLAVPMYGSGLMTQVSDTIFSASAGGESVKLEFIVAEDGSVNQMIMHRKGEKIPVSRVED